MTRLLIVLQPAIQDITEAVDYYQAQGGADVAERFRHAIRSTLVTIQERPGLGAIQPRVPSRLRGCRRWHVAAPFDKLQVFHRSSKTRVEVLRVLHGARDIDRVIAEG